MYQHGLCRKCTDLFELMPGIINSCYFYYEILR